MNLFRSLKIPQGKAICYSGFRDGQHPGGIYPTYEEVKEDLFILRDKWKYLRMYDCDKHTQTVIDVIKNEQLDFKIMVGAYIGAEMNNFNCPWEGGVYSEEILEKNAAANQDRINKLIKMANAYPDIIFSTSVGNEASVEWTDHYVDKNKIRDYVRQVKSKTKQPVTYCENYVPWLHKLENLALEVDIISIHTYPVWEYKHIAEGLDYTKENYYAVAHKYPDKAVAITEAGWATKSNGSGINPGHVNEKYQKIYYENLMKWAEEESILAFFFEAFDENWKGSHEPHEPEKHWGLYKIDRTPKLAMK